MSESSLACSPRLDAFIPNFSARMADCWDMHTSNDRKKWRASVPAYGQCAVTSLLVQDHFGGKLVRGEFEGGSHYWNRLPDGTEIDLTASQFETIPDFKNVAFRSRKYVLSYPDTVVRYRLLVARFNPSVSVSVWPFGARAVA